MTERDSVGVVGDDEVAERLREAGVTVETGTPETVPATDAVVAVGEGAVTAVARAERDPLVVPVDAGRGLRSVARESVPAAVAALNDPLVERHPLFEVCLEGRPVATAAFDVTAVTAEAARISEYTVETTTDSVGQFRADGVTMATAAGSPGYARRIGGPVLAPAESVGAVVPIAPFQTSPDHWVVSLDDLSVAVERDEAVVALYVDGAEVATVACGESTRLRRAGQVRVAVVPESTSRFR
jgi:NAD+ kinase